MKDLYKQLGVSDAADGGTIRAALAGADPPARDAAEFILLDPKRREVYDRNRQVLLTVGRLRGNLGLNLTRFWPRARFADFTVDLAPPPPTGRRRYIDPMAMAWAFGVTPVRRAARRGRHWLIGLVVLSAVVGAAVAWFVLRAG